MKRLTNITISTLPYVFVFFGSLYSPLDADLGWHLRYGEYFLKHLHPLYTNPYSTLMPNFHWPNSSWLTDIISYSVFKLWGFIGLSILSAFVVTLIFFIISKTFKLSFLKQVIFLPILLYLELPINNVSFRGQQLSLLFLALLLFLMNTHDQKIFKIRRIYLLPLLMFVWVNTHGEYLLGLGVMAVWITGYIFSNFLTTEKKIIIIKKKERIINSSPYTYQNAKKTFKVLKIWIIIFLLSFLATLIDPFGFSIYKEALVHIGNSDLKYIAEYLPFQDLSSDWRNMFLTGALLLIGAIILFLNGQLIKKLPNILVVFVLFFLALQIKRFAWPFYYTTPVVLGAFFDFDKKSNTRMHVAGIIFFIFAIITVIYYHNPLDIFHFSWEAYCRSYIDCSPRSAEYLKTHTVKKPLWTNYNWGGWLIWNYPEIKPSIDGRMHLWKDDSGYSAFDEYYPLEQNIKDIDASRYNTVYAWRAKPIIKRLNQLVNTGRWKYVYVDDSAVIAQRISPYTSIQLVR